MRVPAQETVARALSGRHAGNGGHAGDVKTVIEGVGGLVGIAQVHNSVVRVQRVNREGWRA